MSDRLAYVTGVAIIVMVGFALGGKIGLVSTTYALAGGLAGGFLIGVLVDPTESRRPALDYGVFAAVTATALFMILSIAYNVILTGRYKVTLTPLSQAPSTIWEKLYVYVVYEGVNGIVYLVVFIIGGAGGAYLAENGMKILFPSRARTTPEWMERTFDRRDDRDNELRDEE